MAFKVPAASGDAVVSTVLVLLLWLMAIHVA